MLHHTPEHPCTCSRYTAQVYAYTYKTKAFFVACSEEKVESCEVSTRQNQRSLNALGYVFANTSFVFALQKYCIFVIPARGNVQNR